MCHDMCYSDMTASVEMFKVTDSSQQDHNIRVYERCEPAGVAASYCVNNVRVKYQLELVSKFRQA